MQKEKDFRQETFETQKCTKRNSQQKDNEKK